ncbi:AI-2E family transporter [Microbacterium indicum]|uniref:AI-2E family transporter n=1 Tax=Microbacterium indicum TaxID=358100 RepID=UPI0004266634|nr:AI-2E family transporter [Microbacterium indicum]
MSEAPGRRGLFGRRRDDETAPDESAPDRPSHDDAVPPALRVAAAYGWRLLVLVAVVAVVVWLVIKLSGVVIPLLVAVLLTALLWPAFGWLVSMRVPRWLAIVLTVVGTAAIVTGLVWLVVWQISDQAGAVRVRAVERWNEFEAWLMSTGVFADDDLSQGFSFVTNFLSDQSDVIVDSVLSLGSTIGHIGAGALIALFSMICFLFDGEGIWRWTKKLFPRVARQAVDGAARNGWKTLVSYARTQLFVASIDAIGIGVGAALLGVPLAIPIGVTVFLASFVPFVGAIVSGALAVVIALADEGPWIALAMLGVVLLVQQVESHILQPLIMGAAVKVHPLAVVLVVLAGSMVGGIAGALFAVPLAAFVNVVAVTLASGSWRTGDVPDENLMWRTEPRTLGRGDERNEDPR